MSRDYQWVDDQQELTACVARWQQQPFIAIDTEFFRERTYYPALGLIQVADTAGIYLVDPLEMTDLASILGPLLLSTTTEKVFHSGEEDLEIFGRLLGEPIQGVMDTQLMLGFTTGEASVGYARLVEARLGEHVPKDQTRSNWLQRPLTDRQCDYAANDVRWLHQLYPTLRDQVVAKQRLDWVRAECDYLAGKVLSRADDQYYLNLRQGHDLTGNRLWLLQQLALRREARCQELDVNRKALVSDPDLIMLARKRPDSVAGISELTDIRPGVLRREADWILDLIGASHTVDKSRYPEAIQGPLPRDRQDDFQSLRAVLTDLAREQGVPREYLVRKRDLERFLLERVEGNEQFVPAAWQGWRWALFGNLLERRLEERLQQASAATGGGS